MSSEFQKREVLRQIRDLFPEIFSSVNREKTLEQTIGSLSYSALKTAYSKLETAKEKLSTVSWYQDSGDKISQVQNETKEKFIGMFQLIDEQHTKIDSRVLEVFEDFDNALNNWEHEFFYNHNITKTHFREAVKLFSKEVDILSLIMEEQVPALEAVENCILRSEKERIRDDLFNLSMNIKNGLI